MIIVKNFPPPDEMRNLCCQLESTINASIYWFSGIALSIPTLPFTLWNNQGFLYRPYKKLLFTSINSIKVYTSFIQSPFKSIIPERRINDFSFKVISTIFEFSLYYLLYQPFSLSINLSLWLNDYDANIRSDIAIYQKFIVINIAIWITIFQLYERQIFLLKLVKT